MKLVDDDAFHHQPRVVVSLDLGHVLQQRVQRPAGKIVAVKRDQAALRGDQGATGVKVQGRWRVDVDLVVIVSQLRQGITQFVDLVARLQLAVQFIKQRARRHQVQPLPAGVDDVVTSRFVTHRELQALLKKLGHIGLVFCRVTAQQVACGVALGVQIDHQRALALPGADGGQVAGDGGLAHATFLVEYDMLHLSSLIAIGRDRA